jgi:hypothetical protein
MKSEETAVLPPSKAWEEEHTFRTSNWFVLGELLSFLQGVDERPHDLLRENCPFCSCCSHLWRNNMPIIRSVLVHLFPLAQAGFLSLPPILWVS